MEAAREQGRWDGGVRVAFWLAWSLAGLCLAMFVASAPLYVLARSAHIPSSWGADLSVGKFLGGVLFLVFPLVGALIAARRPRNPIGWILLADGLLWMLTGMMDYYGLYGIVTPGSVPFPVIVAGINSFTWVSAVGLLGTYAFLLFPDGRLPSRRWRPLAWLAGVVIVLASILVGLAPGTLQNLGGVRNPFGLGGYPWMETVAYVVLPLVYGSLTVTLVTLYFGGIVVLQRMLVVLTGQQSTLAAVASTLLIAALFTPLRRRIQAFIDRRFYRKKYDAAKTLEEFGATLRDATDLDGLTEEVTGVIRATVQPAHISFWLAPARGKEDDE
jgi:hypothetical protein